MFTGRTTASIGRRLTVLASALALVVMVSGHVAARQLEDDAGSTGTSPCYVDPSIALDEHLRAKLGTTAGCDVIAFG